jgi:hypothetical protein
VSTSPESGVAELGSAPATERALWANGPVLKSGQGNFSGRVFVEVWADGTIQVVTSDRSLITGALRALQSTVPTHGAQVSLPASPVTDRRRQGFLGRVVIDIWSAGAVVDSTGPDDVAAKDAAIRRLQQLA